MKKREKLKEVPNLAEKVSTLIKPINLASSQIDSVDTLPSNYLVCLNNVCCTTQCWTENGQIKCYTICVQMTGGGIGHQWHKHT